MSYIEDLKDPYFEAGEKKASSRGIGCLVFGWVIFGLVLVFAALMVYRFLIIYPKLSRGEVVTLPQNVNEMTRDGSRLAPVNAVSPSDLFDEESHAVGADATSAVLTIVEFGDFACPFCKKVSVPLRTVVERHKDKVRLVYRHFPLDTLHPDAFMAAQVSECAAEQGKFWAMYDKLNINSPDVGYSAGIRYAAELGLDVQQFQMCLDANRYSKRIEDDRSRGKALGISGTPTFYFNGFVLTGAIDEATLEYAIQSLISEK